MGYREQPASNPQFFGKKIAQTLVKPEDVPKEKLSLPRSTIVQLVYWRWKWRGPGGYKIGKLEGASTMEREYLTAEEIEEKYPLKAHGRHFQTGYDVSPSEQMKGCKTVGDVIRVFSPDEVRFADENIQTGPSGPSPS